MGVPTAFALNTADTEAYFAGWRLDISVIVTMNRKAARVSTRACEHVKLEVINHLIIKTWCKRIVFFDK